LKRAAVKKRRRTAAPLTQPAPSNAGWLALALGLLLVMAAAFGGLAIWRSGLKGVPQGDRVLGPYTLALAPDGQDLAAATSLARQAGFEPLGEALMGEGPGHGAGVLLTGVGQQGAKLTANGLLLRILYKPSWQPHDSAHKIQYAVHRNPHGAKWQ